MASMLPPHEKKNRGKRRGITYDFSSCFFSQFKKSTKRGFPQKMTNFFGSYDPKIGKGVLLPESCPKTSKTLKFGLFWGIFACSENPPPATPAHPLHLTRPLYRGSMKGETKGYVIKDATEKEETRHSTQRN